MIESSSSPIVLQQGKWEQMYSRLVTFRRANGHCLVPNRYREDRPLGQWVSSQRRQYKLYREGKKTAITGDRVRLLESINFVWETLQRGHAPWNARYQQLLSYKEENGDCLVPTSYKEIPQLSNWVSSQRYEMRMLKRGKPSRLTPERIVLLNQAGFTWEVQRITAEKKRTSSAISDQPKISFSVPPPTKRMKPSYHSSYSFEAQNFPITQPAIRCVTADSLPISGAEHCQREVERSSSITSDFKQIYPPVAAAPFIIRQNSSDSSDDDRFANAEEEESPNDDRFADAEEDSDGSYPTSAIKEYLDTKRFQRASTASTVSNAPATNCGRDEAAAALLYFGKA
mmetsp:Transcript_62798/g.185441  ORF Transcript_62798/g.185441 Transcript_62798/m.185441 type:complete len:342 (-) Transcript_62798:51-1076(-)